MNKTAVVEELVKIAKTLNSAKYEVEDELVIQALTKVLGRDGLKKWNDVGSYLVDFYFKHTEFSGNVCSAAHNVGSRMVNHEVGLTNELWQNILKAEDTVNTAVVRAMSLYDLDFIRGTELGKLVEMIGEAKQLIIDIRNARL
jgi:radical SAM superfamily enzyme